MTMRSFEHRVSKAEIAGAVVLALVALWFLWHPTTLNIIAGGVFTMITILVIDRLLHTSYIITEDMLTIEKGRFGGKKTICLGDIENIEKVKTLFSHYVLVEYSGSKHAAISTINEDALIKALNAKH